MKYPIVFCDYDNTIFDPDSGCVPARTLAAIADYKSVGGIFVITTGRMYPSIRLQLAKIGLDRDGIAICLQGAAAYDLATDRELFSHGLSPQMWHEVASFVESKGWTFQIYHDVRFFTANVNPYSTQYGAYTGVQPTVVGQPLSCWSEGTDWYVHKMIVMSPASETEGRIAMLKAQFPSLDISQSSDIYIEIVAPIGGKGNGIRAVCSLLGISPDRALGFGDATNDITLLTAVGCGVAVGNAYPQLKQVARYVCAPCADSGVADVLDAVRLGTFAH